MIKLERGKHPKELTEDVCKELTELYMENKENDVWNSPKIKKPLKDALLQMSHNKCAYCECILNEESKDVTIDHFLPKAEYQYRVVEWENLFPACLRCNRSKKDYTGKIVNPCKDIPKEYIAVSKENPFRLKGIDANHVGRNTITYIKLNDIQRVMTKRMQAWETIHFHLQEILEDINEVGYKERFKIHFETLMENCMPDSEYAAVKATNMLRDDCYMKIKAYFKENGKWSDKLEAYEEQIRHIALHMV